MNNARRPKESARVKSLAPRGRVLIVLFFHVEIHPVVCL